MNKRSNYTGYRIDTYRLVSLLGRGSYGDVYLAEHMRNHAHFALKLLFGFTRAEARNFINEASILARLRHPNIVSLVHFGIDKLTGPDSNGEDFPYLVMDYAPGGTLRDRFPLQSQPPLYQAPLDTVVDYICQVASALQCAHDDQIRPIVHCDVKPANMLIADAGRILLSDFGIGLPERITTSSLHTDSQEIQGTPLYMAPEQWNGQAEKASDQYSLGIVAYQWLAGRCPFEGKFAMQLAWQHKYDLPPSLTAQVPGLSNDIEQVIFRALEKEPGKRFASVQEFADALAWASRPDVSGASGKKLLPAPEKPFRRRTILLLVGTAGLTLAGGSATWLAMNRLPQPHLKSAPAPDLMVSPTLTPTPGRLIYAYSKHNQPVNAVTWSPDDTYIASGSDDGTVRVWNATTGVDRFSPLVPDGQKTVYAVNAVAWSPDGKLIASGSDDLTVQVWDAIGNPYRSPYTEHTHPVRAVVWSPDSRYIASGSLDGTVRVWDFITKADLFTPYTGHSPYAVNAVAWSPDGKYIASAGNDMTVQIWDASNGTLRSSFAYTDKGHGLAIAWSPTSQYVAIGGNDQIVQVWDFAARRDRFPPYSAHTVVNALAWSPRGQYIASVGDDHRVQVWNADNGAPHFTYQGHKKELRAVAWSHDGHRIASASLDGSVQVWTIY